MNHREQQLNNLQLFTAFIEIPVDARKTEYKELYFKKLSEAVCMILFQYARMKEEISMGKETILFKSEEKKTSREIAKTLRQIADKIDDGTMMLKKGSEKINVEFPSNMVLELKFEEEQGRRLKKSFEIELEWIIGEEQADGATIL